MIRRPVPPRPRTSAGKAAHWQRALVNGRWDCTAATISTRIGAAYGYAEGRTSSGTRRGSRGTRLHIPRWVVLGWKGGQLRRIVAGWFCQGVATDAHLIAGPLPISDPLNLAGRQYQLCNGCAQEVARPGRNWRTWANRRTHSIRALAPLLAIGVSQLPTANLPPLG